VVSGISTPGNEVLCNVYPNPSEGTFTISINLPKNPSLFTLGISNALGELIYEERLSDASAIFQKEIQLKNQPPGIYLLRCTAKDFQFVKKINIIDNR
jgi:Secretion system C-terminal sorting domain